LMCDSVDAGRLEQNDSVPGNSLRELHALFIPPYTIPQSGPRLDPDLDAHLPIIRRTNRYANRFIKHFRLENFIGWAEDTPYPLPTRADFKEHARLCFNVEQLSSLLRSLHTVRLAVGEGQHRVVLLKDIFLCTRR